jgi:dTMP kinase
LKLTQIFLVASVISTVVIIYSAVSYTVKAVESNSEAKQMSNNPRRNPETNEIRFPEPVLRQMEEIQRESDQRENQARARRDARMTAEERTQIEQERARWRDRRLEHAPETRTEEQIRRDEERAIRAADEDRARRQQAENAQ